MKRVLKWIGIVLAGLVGLVLLTAVILHFVGLSRLNNAPEVATKPFTRPGTDALAHLQPDERDGTASDLDLFAIAARAAG